MSSPVPSTIVRTVLRVVPGPRTAGARAVGALALVAALAAAGRKAWLARAAGRFAAVRGPRFGRAPVAPVALLEAPGATSVREDPSATGDPA